MPVVLPPGLTLARCGQPLAHAVEIAVLALPMVIATLALIPALIICPFLSAAHRDLVIGLLGGLRQWTLALIRPGQVTRARARGRRPASPPVMRQSGRGGCPCRGGTARRG